MCNNYAGIKMNQPSFKQTNKQDALIIWGYILSAVGILFCCCTPLFALPALAMGILAYARGDNRGKGVIIAAVIAIVISGILLGSGTSQRQIHRWVPPQYQGPFINI